MLTAVIALSLGVALVWWLKAGTDEARPVSDHGAATAVAPGAGVTDHTRWARRNEHTASTRAASAR